MQIIFINYFNTTNIKLYKKNSEYLLRYLSRHSVKSFDYCILKIHPSLSIIKYINYNIYTRIYTWQWIIWCYRIGHTYMSSVPQHDSSVDRRGAGKSHIVTIVPCWCYFRLTKLRNLQSYSVAATPRGIAARCHFH